MNLFTYQERAYNEIIHKFRSVNKLLFQANTGYGKTYTFAYIAKTVVDCKKKVVILCHREELVYQTEKTLLSIGVKCQVITPSTKKVHHLTADVYICMVETVYNRLKKGRFTFENIGLVISDECHVRVFDKVYDYFPNSKILGVTATPVSTQKVTFFKCKYCKREHDIAEICCDEEMVEWTKPFTFSQIYEDIVVGADIKELIEFGQLVPEISFVRKYADLSTLKTDSTGEYTSKSLNKAYANENSAFNVLLNYKELCLGKRTIIFNPSAKVNLLIYNKFKEEGINVKIYDSVNSTDVSRKKLVEWFRSNDDAVLLNVNIFTTGFDVREVEAIIVNRKTASLSLWLQMVGRGGRGSQVIFKDSFIVIDGGDNISEFGEWSSSRDWNDIFFNGKGKPKPKRIVPDDIQDCPECGYLFDKYSDECPGCGHTIATPPPKEHKQETDSDDVLEPIRKIPPPSGRHIYEYTKRNNENIHFAFRILQSRIIDMFIYYRVTRDKYEAALSSGELDRKISGFIRPTYFFLIKQSDIKSGTNRTIKYLITKVKEKLKVHYYGK